MSTQLAADISASVHSVRYRLVARSLFVKRGDRELLTGADLDVEPGIVTAVTGPSGSGKTALLMLLAKLERPDAGSVDLLSGESREMSDPVGAERSDPPHIGYVPQTLALVPHLTAAENVAFPLQARRVPPAEVERRSLTSLASVGLETAVNRPATELSGGQRQRIAVARALALYPHILVADEPTTELDASNRDLVIHLIQTCAAAGAAVVLATHDPDVIEQCGRAYRLEAGGLRLL